MRIHCATWRQWSDLFRHLPRATVSDNERCFVGQFGLSPHKAEIETAAKPEGVEKEEE